MIGSCQHILQVAFLDSIPRRTKNINPNGPFEPQLGRSAWSSGQSVSRRVLSQSQTTHALECERSPALPLNGTRDVEERLAIDDFDEGRLNDDVALVKVLTGPRTSHTSFPYRHIGMYMHWEKKNCESISISIRISRQVGAELAGGL